MQVTGNSLPGYRVFEYLLVLPPHEDLRHRIVQVKKEFAAAYQSTGTGGRPHIALAHFLQYEMMEERLLGRLKMIAMGFQPFKVSLRDFGSFPSHTIYINVTSKLPVQKLVKEIRSDAQKLMKLNPDHTAHFLLEPYIALARKLKPWQYEKGWQAYSHKHFTGQFIADTMLLLKRPVGELSYQVVERLSFQNLLVKTKQGDLFGA